MDHYPDWTRARSAAREEAAKIVIGMIDMAPAAELLQRHRGGAVNAALTHDRMVMHELDRMRDRARSTVREAATTVGRGRPRVRLARDLAILEAVDRGCSIAEAAEVAGISRARAHQVVARLRSEGYGVAPCNESKAVTPSPRD